MKIHDIVYHDGTILLQYFTITVDNKSKVSFKSYIGMSIQLYLFQMCSIVLVTQFHHYIIKRCPELNPITYFMNYASLR